MNTPICDFVKDYLKQDALRLHMPGHKGLGPLGYEAYDITEITGADSLYDANGIIAESESNAGTLFGCKTFYSTEGSSQCIKAMLYLALQNRNNDKQPPRIAAGRNSHKALLHAAALLDIDIDWLCPAPDENYLSCRTTAKQLEAYFSSAHYPPFAVYLTSPDYLGNIQDVRALAEVCHRNHCLLIIDNAHGAYLKFLPTSKHPIDLGADMCCDSAHKTLPVLTGGAYLHISDRCGTPFTSLAKHALSLFGSTSPSYLILQSLDAANRYLAEHRKRLENFLPLVAQTKNKLQQHGYVFLGDEPLKFTICAKHYGYSGLALAEALAKQNIVCEFFDQDFVVLMLTPQTNQEGLERLYQALIKIPHLPPIESVAPPFHLPKRACSIREAMLSQTKTVPILESIGRIAAWDNIQCPPAVPIIVCGEVIDDYTIERLQYYGKTHCTVIKNGINSTTFFKPIQ